MSSGALATAYGIPLPTPLAWERHESDPNPVEEAYLRLIEREPDKARVVPA